MSRASVSSGRTALYRITLSFDNGPEPEVTPRVLASLRGAGIKASFFVLGKKLALPGRRELAATAAAEGHWIGNHTFDHGVPLGERDEPGASEREIGRTQALIGDLAHEHRYFRPNGGGGSIGRHLLSRDAVAYLKAGRYSCVLWNAVPRDWAEPEAWVDRALAQCRAQPWSLVVLHDLPTGAMDRLERFIAFARADGAVFVQDFPPSCTLLRDGEETQPLAPFVSGRDGGPA